MAHKIKNKYKTPKSTEFTTKDLVIDVKKGVLFYKSNYGIYKVKSSLASELSVGADTGSTIGEAIDTHVMINTEGTTSGSGNFTYDDSTNLVYINNAQITTVNIDGGTLDGISSLTADGNLDIGNYDFRAQTLTADSLTPNYVAYAGTNGILKTDGGLYYNPVSNTLISTNIGAFKSTGAINFDSQDMTNVDINSGTIDSVSLGSTTQCDIFLSSTSPTPGTGQISIGTGLDVAGTHQLLEIKRVGGQSMRIGSNASSVVEIINTNGNGVAIGSYSAGSDTGIKAIHDSGEYSLSTNGAYDLILTTNDRSYSQNVKGGRIKLLSNPSSGGESIVLKGNTTIYPADNNELGILKVSDDVIAFHSSDKNLKNNIIPISDPLTKLSQIGGYTFDWNDNQTTHTGKDYGVIAQEIEKIMPEIVTTREASGYKAVKYEKIVPLLIECIKEQQNQINSLISQING